LQLRRAFLGSASVGESIDGMEAARTAVFSAVIERFVARFDFPLSLRASADPHFAN
jgi:hypothetical protein